MHDFILAGRKSFWQLSAYGLHLGRSPGALALAATIYVHTVLSVDSQGHMCALGADWDYFYGPPVLRPWTIILYMCESFSTAAANVDKTSNSC